MTKRFAASALLFFLLASGARAGVDAEGFSVRAPKVNDRVLIGEPLTFSFEAPAEAADLGVLIAAGPVTDDRGLLREESVIVSLPATRGRDGMLQVRLPAGTVLSRRPGRYFWQAAERVDGVKRPVTAARAFHIDLPVSAQRRGPLGPRRAGGSLVPSSSGLPKGVTLPVFRSLAQRSAARWGLRVTGTTKRAAGREDGVNVIGFGADVPSNVLGVQRDLMRSTVRTVRRCRGGRCTLRRSTVSTRVVDRDVTIRTGVSWWLGPGPPPLWMYDLESVLIHELGHFAGNKAHTPECTNSPMASGLAAGEWWHGPKNRFSFCGEASSSRSGRIARAASLRGRGAPRRPS